jgi:hypothetical protein
LATISGTYEPHETRTPMPQYQNALKKRLRTTTIKTEGQRLLLAVPGTIQSQATAYGTKNLVSIYEWRDGRKLPSAAARARMQSAFGIPPEAWDWPPATLASVVANAALVSRGNGTPAPGAKPARPTLPADPPPAAAPDGPRPSSLEHTYALLDSIRRQREAPGLTAGERNKITQNETHVLALRARLESAAELSEDRYVREHPAWIKLRTALIATLLPHPKAAQAVADMLSKLGM